MKIQETYDDGEISVSLDYTTRHKPISRDFLFHFWNRFFGTFNDSRISYYIRLKITFPNTDNKGNSYTDIEKISITDNSVVALTDIAEHEMTRAAKKALSKFLSDNEAKLPEKHRELLKNQKNELLRVCKMLVLSDIISSSPLPENTPQELLSSSSQPKGLV